MGSRAVLAVCLLGTVALAFGAFRLDRANILRFDAAIGRPTRPIKEH
jgi:hypothetical protein